MFKVQYTLSVIPTEAEESVCR